MKLFHRHRWTVVPGFAVMGGRFEPSTFPPIWACPCGETKDIMSIADWGLD